MNKQPLWLLLQQALSSQCPKDRQRFYSQVYKESFGITYTIVKNRFPHQADDVTQDFYCSRILNIKLEKYNEIFEYLEGYLIRVLVNFCFDVRHRIEREASVLNIYSEKYQLGSPFRNMIHPEQITDRIWLEYALNKLNDRQLSAFLLHNYFGYKYKEIPELMNENISVGAAKQLVIRAKKKLRKCM